MNNEFERDTLIKTFIRFIVPSILSQWVYILYTIVDGIFVSRGVSEVALSAMNIITPYTLALFAVGITIAVGSSAVISIRIGEGRIPEAKQIYTRNLVLTAAASAVITLVVMLNLGTFADFLGATPANKSYVIDYLKGVTPFAFSFLISYYLEMLIKTDGYPQLATWIVITGSGLNILLDYLFVIVLPYGVFGAAFATGVSNTVVIMLYLTHFLGKKGILKLTPFSWDLHSVPQTLYDGLSSGITEISSGVIVLLFNRAIVRYLDENALISYSVVTYIQCLAVYTMVGVSQGYQPLVGYFFGAKRPETYHKLLRYALIAQALLTVVIVSLCMFATRLLVTMYLPDTPENQQLITDTVHIFRIFSLSYIPIGVNVVVSGFFLSIENGIAASTISALRGAVLLAVFLVLFIALFGGQAIWWVPTASEVLTMAVSGFFLYCYAKKIQK